VSRSQNAMNSTPFAVPVQQPRNMWTGMTPPAPNAFMDFQRARLRKGRSRKSSSSASGHSSMASPIPQSPPQSRNADNSGYFARDAPTRSAGSRRESLTLGTYDLHISSGNDSGDEASKKPPMTPGVVQRPVTRRGNLKVRTFRSLCSTFSSH